eukprot:7621374-Alexandrium_andersonii.AAC.1
MAHGPRPLSRVRRPDAQPLLAVAEPERGPVHGSLVPFHVEEAHATADVAPAGLGLLRELSPQPLRDIGQADAGPELVVVEEELGGVL